jgi:hypothetical protein
LHFCGNLHLPQERVLNDGCKVIKVGMAPEGSYAPAELDRAGRCLEVRLEVLPARQ